MKKIFYSLIISLIVFVMFAFPVLAVLEDFTTYTEVDPDGDITVSPLSASWTDFRNEYDAYLYKDTGATNNSSMSANFEFNMYSTSGIVGQLGHFAITDGLGARFTLRDTNNNYGIFASTIYASGAHRAFLAVVDHSGTGPNSGYINITPDTNYYGTFRYNKTEETYGKAYFDVYTDSERETLLGSTSVTLEESMVWQYVMVAVSVKNPSYGSNPLSAHYGYTDNLVYQMVSDPPEVTTGTASNIVYDSFFATWNADVTGEVTDDGGENITGSFYYKKSTDSEWLWANTTGTYSTGDNFTATLVNLESDTTYDYFARGINTGGQDDGSTLQFSINETDSAPTINTLAFPLILNVENLTATIYGQVAYWGGANVTAYFNWRESTSENWTISSNITDLQTNDLFSVNITSLSLGVTYQYQAYGQNSFGTSDGGGIAQFVLETLGTPSVESISVNATDVQARFTGEILDLGNDPQLTAYFEFREVGEIDWIETTWTFHSEIGLYTNSITGLIPNTNYEFRAVANAFVAGMSSYTDYGDLISFTTLSTYSTPIVQTGGGAYISEGIISVDTYLYYDGGYPSTIWSEFKEKDGGSIWIDSDFKVYGAVTGNSGTVLLSGLKDKTSYEYRSVGSNSVGNSTGSIKEFYIDYEGGIIDTDDEPETGIVPIDILKDWLSPYGLANSIGYWLVVIVLMVLMFLLFYESSVLRIVMPMLVLGAGVVSGLIDTWLVILLAVPAGLLIVWIIKKSTG